MNFNNFEIEKSCKYEKNIDFYNRTFTDFRFCKKAKEC